jgi:hypothetical protein
MAAAKDVPWSGIAGAIFAGIATSIGLAAFARRPQ